MAKRSDTFLADDLQRSRPLPRQRVTLMDGFRFGFGATIGSMAVLIVISALTWALVAGLHLR